LPDKNLENRSSMSFIDLLVLTLAQHEKNLSSIIKRLEEISEKLEKISIQMENAKNLVYKDREHQ